MSSIVLFIFEGRKTEPNITGFLQTHFFNESDKTLIKASFGHNIYQLHEASVEDDGLDITGLIIEALEQRRDRGDALSESERSLLALDDLDVISDIYLFFDHDKHCTNADDEKLASCLDSLSHSQESGLLCISYPMVEAIKHISCRQNKTDEDYQLVAIEALSSNYKKWLNKQINAGALDKRYQNPATYTQAVWHEIIIVNLKRANQLINGTVDVCFEPIDQLEVLRKQQEKHLPDNHIAVLSAFPLALLDYYGASLRNKILNEE